jgi:hypothetical protein
VQPRRFALFVLFAALPAHALSPDATELIAVEKKLAASDCRNALAGMEHLIAVIAGDTAREAETAQRARARAADPEALALRKRRAELLNRADKMPKEDVPAVMAAREASSSACPWSRMDKVPKSFRPAASADEARRLATRHVPVILARWRACEALVPKHKGELDRAWPASRFAKLDLPEMQEYVRDALGWMRYELAVKPDSRYAKDFKAPSELPYCRSPEDLKRLEAAMPAGFLK